MGNNQAYSDWEQLIIRLTDAGKMDLEVLDIISEVYRGLDVDHGGASYITTKDGLDADQVAIKLVDPEWVADPDDEDAESDKFYDIKTERWGWW